MKFSWQSGDRRWSRSKRAASGDGGRSRLGRSRLGFEALEPRRLLATFFVDSTDGNDTQSVGSIDQPFKTIDRAALFAQAGDTVAVRGGVYREEVSLTRSGTAAGPITFEAYNGEEVLVTTTDILSGWTQHSGNIYKTTFDSSVMGRNGMTLFVDGQLTTEAHWSDLGASVDTLVSSNFASMSSGDKNSITDSALVGLPNDYWNGGFVWSQTSDFTIETRRIADFDGSTGRITLASPFNNDPRSGDRFLIYDHINALNAPGEWYFDDGANTLYLWAPGGGDPDNYTVEVKTRREGFDLNGNDYIHIKGIDFRGGDIDMSGSSNVLLQGAHIVAPNRGFGPEGSGGAQALVLSGSGNVIRDNEIEYAWGTVAHVSGDNNQLINNYVHHVGFNNSNSGFVYLDANAEETLIGYNTIEHVGRAAVGGVGGVRTVIEHNDMSRVAQMSSDVGAIYLLNNSLGNLIVRYNVFHDITAHLSNGIYFDNNASDAAVHHNITYNTSAFGGKVNLPTSYILWYNNTHFNSGRIDAWGPSTSRDSSTGSKFFNNIISALDSDLTSSSDPSEASNNVFTTSSANFVNAASGDFRLASGSAAIDAGRLIQGVTDGFTGAAPDAGAIEFGQAMWAYGHDFNSPPNPFYEWTPLPFTNRVANTGFDSDLNSWAATAGSPSFYFGNAWNYRADALAISGNGAVEIKPGDQIEQTVEGLAPNTTYQVTSFARLVKDYQLEDSDAASRVFSTGNHRGETYISGVTAGDWVRFDAVDFGTGAPRYDRIELGTEENSSLSVQLRLGSPTGQLIGTLSVPSRGQPWFMTRANISAVTGTHDLYVVFQGSGGADAKFDRIRLLDTTTDERVTLGVMDYNNAGDVTTQSIGGAYWADVPESLTFTTGPSSNSATIFLTKQGGDFNAYIDLVTLSGDAYLTPAPSVLSVYVDPATGWATLSNETEAEVLLSGYTFTDIGASLQPTNWFSLADQRVGGGGWSETSAVATYLSESASGDSLAIAPGGSIYLGTLVDPGKTAALTFEYSTLGGASPTEGILRFESPVLPPLPGDYNNDLTVDSADYTVWRDGLGSQVAPFDGADGNGNGIVDAADYLLWRRNFGASIINLTLIDGTLGNGSFEDLTGATPDLGGNRIGGTNATSTIPGWTAQATNFGGFDDSRSYGASDGTEYAFVNNGGSLLLTSSPLNYTTKETDRFTISIDVGSNQSLTHAYEVRIGFGGGVAKTVAGFSDGTNASTGSPPLTTYTFEYVATGEDVGLSPYVEVFMDNLFANGSSQTYVDNIKFRVQSTNAPDFDSSTLIETPLVNATLRNGSFEDLTGGTPDLGSNRIGGPDSTATIPGWTAVSTGFGGFDDSRPNGSSHGTEYAFINKLGTLTLTSDPIATHTTQAGDVFTLTLDVGNNMDIAHDYEVRLRFGSVTRTIGDFSDATNVDLSPNELTTYSFSYLAGLADAGELPVIEIYAVNSGGNSQCLIDNVRLTVGVPGTAMAAAAAEGFATTSATSSPLTAAVESTSAPTVASPAPAAVKADEAPFAPAPGDYLGFDRGDGRGLAGPLSAGRLEARITPRSDRQESLLLLLAEDRAAGDMSIENRALARPGDAGSLHDRWRAGEGEADIDQVFAAWTLGGGFDEGADATDE